MLEAAGFDFRNRHPQKLVIKLLRLCHLERTPAGKTAYNMCLDMYRTFAPLKQTAATMAMACVELAARLCDVDMSDVRANLPVDSERLSAQWSTSRTEIMGT